jgi:hypothetical protein
LVLSFVWASGWGLGEMSLGIRVLANIPDLHCIRSFFCSRGFDKLIDRCILMSE